MGKAQASLTVAAMDALLTIAVVFLALLWLEYALDLKNLRLNSSLIFYLSVIGFIAPSFVYLKLLLYIPGLEWFASPSKTMTNGVILTVAGVPGASYWWYVSEYSQERYLFLVPSLVFVILSILAFGPGTWRPGLGSSGSKPELPKVSSGRTLFVTYGISMMCYLILIALIGISFPDVENDFADNLNVNLAFCFLVPVHSVALLAYTISRGRKGMELGSLTIRITLCLSMVFLSYSGLVLFVTNMYGE